MKTVKRVRRECQLERLDSSRPLEQIHSIEQLYSFLVLVLFGYLMRMSGRFFYIHCIYIIILNRLYVYRYQSWECSRQIVLFFSCFSLSSLSFRRIWSFYSFFSYLLSFSFLSFFFFLSFFIFLSIY